MLKKTGMISTLLLIIVSTNLWAETGQITALVTNVLVTEQGVWGGCAAQLDKDIATEASVVLDCPEGGWVTFSCDGTYNSKDIAYRKLDIAQKSEVTGHQVIVYIDDTRKHNGVCYASTVISINQ